MKDSSKPPFIVRAKTPMLIAAVTMAVIYVPVFIWFLTNDEPGAPILYFSAAGTFASLVLSIVLIAKWPKGNSTPTVRAAPPAASEPPRDRNVSQHAKAGEHLESTDDSASATD